MSPCAERNRVKPRQGSHSLVLLQVSKTTRLCGESLEGLVELGIRLCPWLRCVAVMAEGYTAG